MCGVAGVLSFRGCQSVDPAVLKAMRDAMMTRGPDGEGLWISPNAEIGLAHRRLAIQDLTENGAQPMESVDGSVVVVFNGEIYNQPELRKLCESRGAVYKSASDTETLLHLYLQEGDQFVRRLRGMFAFAIWDKRNRRLVLARDPFGIKPLYYSSENGQFRFASQMKSLLAGGSSDEVDPAGLISFLIWGYVTEPHTWRAAIKPVKAGSILVVHADGAVSESRFNDPISALREPKAHGNTTLREALLDSVKHHLISDVPVGLFLSAGLDSGTLLSLASDVTPERPLHAITLGFGEFTGTPDDEIPLARDVAKRFSAHHSCLTFTADDFAQMRGQVFHSMDQPSVDGINTFFVSKAASESGLKVAFSGVGGDELFGGYPSFEQVPKLASSMPNLPRFGRAFRAALDPLIRAATSPKYAGIFEYGGSLSGAYLLRRALFMPWELPDLVGEEVATEGLEKLNLMESLDAVTSGIQESYHKVMALETSVYLQNCLLRDADWAGMAHSLEIRTPLVDSVLFGQVAEITASSGVPRKVDFANSASTPLLRHEQARRKTGFNVPFTQWLSKPGVAGERGKRGWAREVMQAHGFVPR